MVERRANVFCLRWSGTSGFEAMREQLNRKLTKRGFEFCIMVVGEAGLGKTTFVDTLFAVSRWQGEGESR